MSNNFRDFLEQVLTAIDYQGDKAEFIDRFLKNIHTQAYIELIKSLPAEKQGQIEQQLKDGSYHPEDVLKQIFSEEQIQESLKKTTQETITNYFQAINPSLNKAQTTALLEVCQKLNPQTST